MRQLAASDPLNIVEASAVLRDELRLRILGWPGYRDFDQNDAARLRSPVPGPAVTRGRRHELTDIGLDLHGPHPDEIEDPDS